MRDRVLFALPAVALLTLACGLTSLLPGGTDVQTAPGLPKFEQDDDRVIQLVEDGQARTLYDLINESDDGEMFKPGVQRYTADIHPDDLIDLSTGWCAKNTSIMEENEKHITGAITVDGYVIPDDQLVSFISDVGPGDSDDYPDGLACYSWDVVASQWPVGTHHVTESWTLDATVDDGYEEYQAGEYAIEFTITVKE